MVNTSANKQCRRRIIHDDDKMHMMMIRKMPILDMFLNYVLRISQVIIRTKGKQPTNTGRATCAAVCRLCARKGRPAALAWEDVVLWIATGVGIGGMRSGKRCCPGLTPI